VQIIGNYLDNTTSVSFNGTAAPGFTIDSPTQLTVTVPAGATTGPVQVGNSAGAGTSAGVFTVLQLATITSRAPAPHTVAAPAGSAVALTLSQPTLAGPAAGFWVMPSQTANLPFNFAGVGTTSLSATHATAFRPGEKVAVTVPETLPVGPAYALRKEVYNFIVATGGSGRGYFTGSPALAAGTGPLAVATADFNNDGFLDAVVANGGSASLDLYRGSSAGLAPQQALTARAGLQDIAVADFNHDRDMDIVSICPAPTGGPAGMLVVHVNAGSGLFYNADQYTVVVGASPVAVAVGDLNADGLVDVVTANAGSNDLTVVLNHSAGLATLRPLAYPVPATPQGLALADVDGDGDLDAVLSYGGRNAVGILRNNGDGGFTPDAALLPVGAAPQGLALDDLDNDGDVDLAVANSGSGTVSIRWGNGLGGFATGPDLPVGSAPGRVALADVDADGDLDVLAANRGGTTTSLLRNNRSGSFATELLVRVGNGPAALALGDLDGDGDLDLLTANSGDGTTSVCYNAATATATTPAWAGAVTLYPNPAHACTTLTLPQLPAAQLTLRNALGQTIRTERLPAHTTSTTLRLPNLPAGLYLLHLDAGEAGQLTQRLLLE
jgi:hypothetical protein